MEISFVIVLFFGGDPTGVLLPHEYGSLEECQTIVGQMVQDVEDRKLSPRTIHCIKKVTR